jgi:hypothetical protein
MKTQISTVLCMMILAAGCASQEDMTAATESDDVVDQTLKADRSVTLPAGRYAIEGSGFHAGDMTQLTLNADMSFGGNEFVYCNGGHGLNCGLRRGTYAFTRSASTGNRFIRLFDKNGDLSGRYQYRQSTGKLLLKSTEAGSVWFTMDAVPADEFVADAKEAYVHTPSDQLLAVDPLDLPADAAKTFADESSSDSLHTHAWRYDVDGLFVYAVVQNGVDIAVVKLFDETGKIADATSDFTGHLHW